MRQRSLNGKQVDLDLSWLQATGKVSYIRSDSTTADTYNYRNLWGKNYERILRKSRINASKDFEDNLPVRVFVKIVKGTVLINTFNSLTDEPIETIKYSIYSEPNWDYEAYILASQLGGKCSHITNWIRTELTWVNEE